MSRTSDITTLYSDITKLNLECIVNSANVSGLGCFKPNHHCVDEAIHMAAGSKLLEECKKLTRNEYGARIPIGEARITSAYNLPCKYIIHTTGPMKNPYEHLTLEK